VEEREREREGEIDEQVLRETKARKEKKEVGAARARL
jgi:hypothetical protein